MSWMKPPPRELNHACMTFATALPYTGSPPAYRDGADVQRLLPKLSTYLGHVHIFGTQRYLTLTPELLR